MTRALIFKELREHAWIFVALFVLQALSLLGMLHQAEEDGSAFVALKSFTASMGTLAVLVVNNRLVVREYSGRTQLFLETLPVTRLRVLLVKLLLGAVLIIIPMLTALAICAQAANGREPVDSLYLAILGARAGAFLLCVHGMAFLAGILGRFRFVFWGALAMGLFVLDENDLKVSAVPLFRLIDEQMPFERHTFPRVDLLVASGIGLVCVASALALALTQQGGLAANLARKMSHQEKVFFGGLALVVTFIQTTLKVRKPPPLFELAKAARATEGKAFVGIAATDEGKDGAEQAQEIGRALAVDLEELRVWLDLSQLPPVFVVPDSSLDPGVFIRAQLADTDGVVLKAALSNPAQDPLAFRAFVLEEVLAWYSRNRSLRERMVWFSAGFAHWWVLRARPDDRLALRAASASPNAVTVESLRTWMLTRERLGDCIGDALETRLVSVLAEMEGEATFKALARKALGVRPHNDVRATLTRRPFAQLMEEHGTVRLPALVDAFNQQLSADRARLAEPLSRLRRLKSTLSPRPVGNGSGFEVFHEVRAEPEPSDAAGDEPVEYSLRYASLGPWHGRLSSALLPRSEARGNGVVPRVFPRGVRIFWAFETEEPVLDCRIRIASGRTELR